MVGVESTMIVPIAFTVLCTVCCTLCKWLISEGSRPTSKGAFTTKVAVLGPAPIVKRSLSVALTTSGGWWSVINIWWSFIISYNKYLVVLLQALAAGTLLYVTVSEVLPRERARWHERQRSAGVAQFFAVTLGFTLMYLMTRYLGESAFYFI